MILNKVVKSTVDNTVKYIFKNSEGFTLEFSYINKNDGKDIICVPCQTMCPLGCKFCHCLEYRNEIKSKKLSYRDIIKGIFFIRQDLELSDDKPLLISFMGLGEPLLNVDEIVRVMNTATLNFKNVRFGVATCIPKNNWEEFFKFTRAIECLHLNVKLHFSLHYPYDSVRKEWIPSAWDIKPSLLACKMYKLITGNPVEIHYTLIEGVNDSITDAAKLAQLIKNDNFNVKFLYFNEKKSLEHHRSNYEKYEVFGKILDEYNITHEYYIPPGLDIGASCGQFLMENY